MTFLWSHPPTLWPLSSLLPWSWSSVGGSAEDAHFFWVALPWVVIQEWHFRGTASWLCHFNFIGHCRSSCPSVCFLSCPYYRWTYHLRLRNRLCEFEQENLLITDKKRHLSLGSNYQISTTVPVYQNETSMDKDTRGRKMAITCSFLIGGIPLA